jgi:hypothetical protein
VEGNALAPHRRYAKPPVLANSGFALIASARVASRMDGGCCGPPYQWCTSTGEPRGEPTTAARRSFSTAATGFWPARLPSRCESAFFVPPRAIFSAPWRIAVLAALSPVRGRVVRSPCVLQYVVAFRGGRIIIESDGRTFAHSSAVLPNSGRLAYLPGASRPFFVLSGCGLVAFPIRRVIIPVGRSHAVNT